MSSLPDIDCSLLHHLLAPAASVIFHAHSVGYYWEEAPSVPSIIYDSKENRPVDAGKYNASISLVNLFRALAECAGVADGYQVDG